MTKAQKTLLMILGLALIGEYALRAPDFERFHSAIFNIEMGLVFVLLAALAFGVLDICFVGVKAMFKAVKYAFGGKR